MRAVTSGPAVNVYISLRGREPNGIVSHAEYVTLQNQVVNILTNFADNNDLYRRPESACVRQNLCASGAGGSTDPQFGRGTSEFIGQDSGDVYALLRLGYNFDGAQFPVVQRAGDATSTTPVLSVPNFYGAHGYDPLLPEMSAIFYAAGPDIRRGTLPMARNIDLAPSVSQLLGVLPATTVQGSPLTLRIPRKVKTAVRYSLLALAQSADKQQANTVR